MKDVLRVEEVGKLEKFTKERLTKDSDDIIFLPPQG